MLGPFNIIFYFLSKYTLWVLKRQNRLSETFLKVHRAPYFCRQQEIYSLVLSTSTVESRRFEVIGTIDFTSKYRNFELQGGRHKNIYPPSSPPPQKKKKRFSPIKQKVCVRKTNVSGRRFFYEHKTTKT